MRVGGNIPAPRRTYYVAPSYPSGAIDAGIQGAVQIEVTIGREGRVADARVVRSVAGLDDAALTAVRQWEYEPTVVDGRAVPLIHIVSVPFTLPERPKPQPPPEQEAVKPAPPPAPVPAPSAVQKPAEPPKPPPPSPAELREQAVAGVRDALRRFEVAWESLDAAAIGRVQVLSPAESAAVKRMIQDAESYVLEIADPQITIDPDNKTATVTGVITRRFRPRVGTAQTSRITNTLRLEKRGDIWVIVSLR